MNRMNGCNEFPFSKGYNEKREREQQQQDDRQQHAEDRAERMKRENEKNGKIH